MRQTVMENRVERGSNGSQPPATGAGSDGTIGSTRPIAGPVRRRPVHTPRRATPGYVVRRARKDRGPNWNPLEISALIHANRQMFLEELDVVDGRDLMNPDATKWVRISIEVMRARCSPCARDGLCCKSKWNQLISDYKKIADFFARTGNNGTVYRELTASNKKAEGLPRSYPQDVFLDINEWFGSRPSMNPPHTRDLLASEDCNYQVSTKQSAEEQRECDSDEDFEDPMDLVDFATAERSAGTSQTASPGIPDWPTLPATVDIDTRNSSPTVSPLPRPRHPLPVGVQPLVLSSSDTSDYQVKRQTGNTGVRRKNVSGHGLIAEATRASGAFMASQMKDMADASRDLEQSKIQVQLKLFSEQMDYQREKDRRLHDNARIANETARLAIHKQSEVVKCLATLSEVLSGGLHLAKGKEDVADPQTDRTPHEEGAITAPPETDIASAPTSEQPSAAPET